MGSVSFQILSDLHLETHPSYNSFTFPQTAANLALLGDIGHVANNQLFTFLEAQLLRYSTVFFLLGNHEPYHMSFKLAKTKMRQFQSKMDRRSLLGKFIFLDQTRYDITEKLSILGCTLFSRISPQQEFAVERRMVDFRDILRWTVDDHNAAHESDVSWLNAEVMKIETEEPHRQIVVFTHHSPCKDRCQHLRHKDSEVWTGFATNLSDQVCWQGRNVTAWASGHTHFNYSFLDETGKMVLSNQKGYRLFPSEEFNAGRVSTFGDKTTVSEALE
ncbi:hypothetical protein N7493_009285 [Penicillium malachiteum]|uniref:Calcineurin-like phosphoesterase domain-containing protein n=1 Tax=Penicillium malachiteum TaxID=1324776 RepID=A0AAD6MTF8_9EURO|nr:hypothetical protein N7493_009285 [Penicillium malachiteum]